MVSGSLKGNTFAAKFSASAFSWVFEFVNGYIDFAESDKNKAVHFCLKSKLFLSASSPVCSLSVTNFILAIWCNFGTRVKLYMDWVADPQALSKSEHSRKELLDWVPVMAHLNQFHLPTGAAINHPSSTLLAIVCKNAAAYQSSHLGDVAPNYPEDSPRHPSNRQL